MHLICNKHAKKLFPVPATFFAVAGNTYFRFINVEVFECCHFSLQIAGQRIVKFNHPTTAKAHHMMVLLSRFNLIVMMVLAKMQFVHHIQLFQHLQSAINRGEAEAWLHLTGTEEYLIGIKMPAPLADDIHYQGALVSKSLAGVIQFPAACIHFTAALIFKC